MSSGSSTNRAGTIPAGEARSPIRKSSLCLALAGVCVVLLALLPLHATRQVAADAPSLERLAATVRDLELTDLALFTEARYTRHLSQADLFSAFQDHPGALEHFPAGSLAGPPPAARRRSGP